MQKNGKKRIRLEPEGDNKLKPGNALPAESRVLCGISFRIDSVHRFICSADLKTSPCVKRKLYAGRRLCVQFGRGGLLCQSFSGIEIDDTKETILHCVTKTMPVKIERLFHILCIFFH